MGTARNTKTSTVPCDRQGEGGRDDDLVQGDLRGRSSGQLPSVSPANLVTSEVASSNLAFGLLPHCPHHLATSPKSLVPQAGNGAHPNPSHPAAILGGSVPWMAGAQEPDLPSPPRRVKPSAQASWGFLIRALDFLIRALAGRASVPRGLCFGFSGQHPLSLSFPAVPGVGTGGGVQAGTRVSTRPLSPALPASRSLWCGARPRARDLQARPSRSARPRRVASPRNRSARAARAARAGRGRWRPAAQARSSAAGPRLPTRPASLGAVLRQLETRFLLLPPLHPHREGRLPLPGCGSGCICPPDLSRGSAQASGEAEVGAGDAGGSQGPTGPGNDPGHCATHACTPCCLDFY